MVAAAISQNLSLTEAGIKIECWLWGENKQKGKRRIRSCPASLAGSLSLVERAEKKWKKHCSFDSSVNGRNTKEKGTMGNPGESCLTEY